jgi:hypothetical protein
MMSTRSGSEARWSKYPTPSPMASWGLRSRRFLVPLIFATLKRLIVTSSRPSADCHTPVPCSQLSSVTSRGGRVASAATPVNTYFGVAGVKSARSLL